MNKRRRLVIVISALMGIIIIESIFIVCTTSKSIKAAEPIQSTYGTVYDVPVAGISLYLD